MTCKSVNPPTLGENVFGETDTDIPLYVPEESISLYQAAERWKDFQIQAIEPESYNIIYKGKDAVVLDTENIFLNLPDAPAFVGFTFVGWDIVAGHLEDGIVLQAIYSADEPTSAPSEYINPSNLSQKLIREGNVYILRDNKTYTITGAELK